MSIEEIKISPASTYGYWKVKISLAGSKCTVKSSLARKHMFKIV
jgi:hypothetical protein